MTASEIAFLHNNKLARHNFKYYGPTGIIYIGQADGRLKRQDSVSNTLIQETGVKSVTGLNTDNSDPSNPVIQISVDGVTITGTGIPGNPLVASGAGLVQTVTDDGNGVVTVDNTDPVNPVIQFNGVDVDGVTITGDGTIGNPLVSVSSPSGVQTVTDDGNGVVTIDNTDPINPVIQFNGVNVDGITITGDGTFLNPLVSAAASGFTYSKNLVNTTPYTIVPTSGYNVYNVDATAGAIVVNFPTAVANAAWYVVKKIDSSLNTVTLTPNGIETIDGAVNKIIKFQNTSVDVYSDNSNLFLA